MGKRKEGSSSKQLCVMLVLVLSAAFFIDAVSPEQVTGQAPRTIRSPPSPSPPPLTAPICGNNIIEQGEMCDDGNTQSLDGCSSYCVSESVKNPVYLPSWNDASPTAAIPFTYNPSQSSQQNGAALIQAIQSLQPGQMLQISAGQYDLASAPLIITKQAASTTPIWIVAAPGQTPLITRSGSTLPVMEIGGQAAAPQARYLIIRGIEITGGGIGIAVHKASNIIIDQLHIHNTGDGGIKSRTENADNLFITNNNIHNTAGYGEGIVIGLGASKLTRDSVVAKNAIYNTQGTSSGDGIELRDGSYNNWIAENYIHHTQFPCILFHAARPGFLNIIERNIVHDCGDNGIQAENGRAIVRNNLLVGPFGNKGFDSSHNAATLEKLYVYHNTIIDEGGYGAGLFAWNGQQDLYFTNNIAYVRRCGVNGYTIAFSAGSAGGYVSGNKVYAQPCSGPGVSGVNNMPSGYTLGNGLPDFLNVGTWAPYTTAANYQPRLLGAIASSGNPSWAVGYDLMKHRLRDPPEPGSIRGVRA